MLSCKDSNLLNPGTEAVNGLETLAQAQPNAASIKFTSKKMALFQGLGLGFCLSESLEKMLETHEGKKLCLRPRKIDAENCTLKGKLL